MMMNDDDEMSPVAAIGDGGNHGDVLLRDGGRPEGTVPSVDQRQLMETCMFKETPAFSRKKAGWFWTAHCPQQMPAGEDEKLWKLCSTIVTQILDVLLGNGDAVQAGLALCSWTTEAGFCPFLLEPLLLHLHFWK